METELEQTKERLSKISPNYNSSGIQNYIDSNFNQNNFKHKHIFYSKYIRHIIPPHKSVILHKGGKNYTFG